MSTSGYENLKKTSTLGPLFQSLSRKLYPRNMTDVMEYAADLWLHEGVYTQTIRKAVRYFMTELSISGKEDGVEDSYEEFITDNYDILEEVAKVGDEALGFGNSFTSVYMPIKRILGCPECQIEMPYDAISSNVTFDYTNISFKGTCPKCNKAVNFRQKEIYDTYKGSVPKILRWDPKMIRISYNTYTDNYRYYMDPSVDTYLANRIRAGDPFFLADTPWEIISAICKSKPVKFNSDNIYHMKFEPPAFLKRHTRGWGIPPFMSDFGNVVILLLLDKYNEVILSDYLVPMRVISPANIRTGSSDVNMDASLMGQVPFEDMRGNIENMIDDHRTNPSKIHAAAHPLQYQVMGGEASQLVPVDIMEHYEQKLLQNIGFPLEFIRKSLNASAGPVIGFKLFERTWQHFSNSLDGWLTWFINTVGALKKWDKVNVETVPSSIYEDPGIKQLKVDLGTSQVISMTDALKPLGIDYFEQQRKRLNEQKFMMDQETEVKKEMEAKGVNKKVITTLPAGAEVMMRQQQAQAQAGGPPPPEAMSPQPPMAGMGNMQNPTLDQMVAQAEKMANQLFGMEETQRKSELINLSKNNPTLHSLVTAKLEDIRQEAETQGLSMARQQAGGPPQ